MAYFFKNYVFLFVFSGVLLGLGVLVLPPLNLPVTKLILAVWLSLYLSLFLFKRLARASGVIFTVLLAEFVIISLISAWLMLGQLNIAEVGALSSLLGFSLWIRSSSALIEEYNAAYSRRSRRSPYIFLLYLSLASLGIYSVAAPPISDLAIAWLVSIASFTLGAVALVFAIIFAAKSRKNDIPVYT